MTTRPNLLEGFKFTIPPPPAHDLLAPVFAEGLHVASGRRVWAVIRFLPFDPPLPIPIIISEVEEIARHAFLWASGLSRLLGTLPADDLTDLFTTSGIAEIPDDADSLFAMMTKVNDWAKARYGVEMRALLENLGAAPNSTSIN